jgi:Tfp pilus assembly protein PilP
MKLTKTLLAMGLMTGGLCAQNPNVIQSVQNNVNAVRQQKTNDSNAALGIKSSPAPASKPAPGAPAKASNSAASATTSAAATNSSAPAPAPAKAQASKTSSAPKTAAAAKHAAAKPAAVKQVAAKSTAKSAEKVSVKAAVVTSPNATAKPAVHAGAKASVKTGEKVSVAASPKAPAKPGEKKNEKTVISAAPAVTPAAAPADAPKPVEAAKPPKPEEKKWAMNGKRDPFFSPVVQQPTGSGCSTGKKCLEIGQINLHGVVKSDAGFIAVVTNNLGKAYFLRENDPVFNGYVVRITGDTVVFQETYTDQLGKPLTREVVKRLSTPAV